MRRFLVFAGSDYYPQGGWDDFICSRPILSEAIFYAKDQLNKSAEWAHVVDFESLQIVRKYPLPKKTKPHKKDEKMYLWTAIKAPYLVRSRGPRR